eukprot:10629545-Ditylum_brightwellii.AAC.1
MELMQTLQTLGVLTRRTKHLGNVERASTHLGETSACDGGVLLSCGRGTLVCDVNETLDRVERTQAAQ